MFKRVLALCAVVLTMGLGIILGAAHVHAAPATLTVTNTNDSGAGSLRQAITDANANGNPSDMDRIEFNIPGSGAQVISLSAELPAITQKVTLDGSTQSGASCSPRSIKVRIDGTGLTSTNGFVMESGADGSIVKGFAITNFSLIGVRIVDVNNIKVVCNNIGLQEDGTTAGPNTESGVIVFEDSDGTIIGGTNEADRNILSNNANGIQFAGNGNTVNSRIEGNYIGTDESGTVAKPNTYCGVMVSGTTSYTTIGGLTAGAGNLISGNANHGICAGDNSTHATIQGNIIGLSADGTSALPNIATGILLNDAITNFTVGGTTAVARNIIAGNGAEGVVIAGTGGQGVVQGNYIGVDITGEVAVPNDNSGILLLDSMTNITIGGATSGARNIISGNDAQGIGIFGACTDISIQGNYIGTDIEGEQAVPNVFHAIIVGESATDILIGGSLVGQGNLISGNEGHGIGVYGSAADTTIHGNYIGTTASGNAALGNNGNGIEIADNASGVVVGGSLPTERNIIAANSSGGITAITNNAEIYGNYIGLGADGLTSLPNNQVPVSFFGGSGNRIGGPLSGQRNVISGEGYVPLMYFTGISGGENVIQGNYIGTDANGQVDEAIVKGPGIVIGGGQADNLIGGTSPAEGNLIAGVRGAGVAVESIVLDAWNITISPAKNAVLGNRIAAVEPYTFLNVNLANQAIDLGGFNDSNDPPDGLPDSSFDGGPNLNDAGDVDTGANGYINTPILKTAVQNGNQLTITYDLDAADSPSNSYRVEFFANDQSSIFGTGPGETYLGADTNVTPGQDKSVTLTVNDDLYQKALSATTTAEDNTTSSGFGGTSEFAQNIGIGNSVDLEADGVLDSVELSFPPPVGGGIAGDGNGDGIPDAEQPNVTTYLIGGIGEGTNDPIFTTFEVNGCSSTASVQDDASTALPVADTGYSYPFGVVSFTLNCSVGVNANVIKYYYTDVSAEGLKLRKYRPSSQSYIDVPATITNEVVGGRNTVKVSYALTDGGQYDDDGEANGVIVDPVGLAIAAGSNLGTGTTGTTGLADTGENTWGYLVGMLSLLTLGAWILRLHTPQS